MSSMNHIILLGGLTRDPELRHTSGGTAICKFSLAVTESYKDRAGKQAESTCYVDIDAWGTLGETIAKHLRKGSEALVQGRLQMEQWEAKDGSKRTKLSVRAFDVQFIGRSAKDTRDREFEDVGDIPSPMRSRSGFAKPGVRPAKADPGPAPIDDEELEEPPF